MSGTLHDIQALLPPNGAKRVSDDPLLRRIALALPPKNGAISTSSVADLAALLRQAMLRAEVPVGQTRELLLPQGIGWPDESVWRRFSCDVLPMGAGRLRVRPRTWQPQWLDAGAADAVNAAIGEEPRRQPRGVPADPCVTKYLSLQSYVSAGQRAAVQAAFLTPAGSTTIISLPTGGGKSLAFQLPALAWRAEGGLVLVIVPTIALARDQESRFRALLDAHKGQDLATPVPLAYHSGLDNDTRGAIKSAIRTGQTPIVFTSPEAAVGALGGALFDAAKRGHLRLFAVDEAHLVAQWGEQFRPEYQTLAGFRDALLEVCPPQARFRSLLLTATLTPEAYETLRFLFSRKDSEFVCELSLRREIAFLLHTAPDEATRIDRVLDAIDHLPRPLILYTTLREHAESWYQRLRERGYSRLRLVRGGDLADEEGAQVLEDWRNRALDMVVATSAFGVGMDQAEIRSVVHACLPETIDRYYQEVGRAGRDGNAAVSLLITAPDDLRVARDLATKRRISVERGFERWQHMWWRRRSEHDGTHILRLDVSPPDLTSPGERSESWNLRTLVLMARAGLIAFGAHAPPQFQPIPDESPDEFEDRRHKSLERFYREITIRVLEDHHLDEDRWSAAVARLRVLLAERDRSAWTLVEEVRNLHRPLNELFSDVYQLYKPPVRPPWLMGSCPITRAQGEVSFVQADPEVLSFAHTDVTPSAALIRHLAPCTDAAGRSWVSYVTPMGSGLEMRHWRKRMVTLLRHVVAQGVSELSVPEAFCEPDDWDRLIAEAPSRFLVRGSFDQGHSHVPFSRVTLLDSSKININSVDLTLRLHRPRHIMIMSRHTPDPSRPGSLLFDRMHHLTDEELLMRLGR